LHSAADGAVPATVPLQVRPPEIFPADIVNFLEKPTANYYQLQILLVYNFPPEIHFSGALRKARLFDLAEALCTGKINCRRQQPENIASKNFSATLQIVVCVKSTV
jgi:hypothetical protein